MPPKNVQQGKPSKSQASGSKKKPADDDDDLLLEQQAQVAQAAAKELAAAKAKDDAKRAAAAAALEAKRVADVAAAEKLPPILVNAVAERIYRTIKAKVPSMRDVCWTAYILHRFLMQAVERHRRLALKPNTHASDDSVKAEDVMSFEVHDDKHPGDLHSWNVFATASGQYAIDMALEQFLPSGRHGYRRDTRPEEGIIPVRSPSRIVPAGSMESTGTEAPVSDAASQVGVVAIDEGVFSNGCGSIDVSLGVPSGTHDTYMKFIIAAHDGRHKKMSSGERAVAEILQRNKAVPQWVDLHSILEQEFLTKEVA